MFCPFTFAQMINLDDFEGDKENIKQVAKGRSLIYSTNYKELKSKLTDDSPFELYLEYFKLLELNNKQDIKTTLKCARLFRKNANVINNIDYVKLWIKIVRMQKDPQNPLDLFKYLIINGIGMNCHLLFREYALFKYSCGETKAANEIIKKGLDLKVNGYQLLSFYPADKVVEEKEIIPEYKKYYNPKGNQKFAVFVDQEEEEEDLFPTSAKDYDYLKGHAKENKQEATSWVGETLKQNKAVVSEKLSVFKDAEASEQRNPSTKRDYADSEDNAKKHKVLKTKRETGTDY